MLGGVGVRCRAYERERFERVVRVYPDETDHPGLFGIEIVLICL